MSEQVRNRVTGAVFVLALAAIFLPMLFDGAGVRPPEIPPPAATPQGDPVPDYDEVVPASDVVEKVTQLRATVDAEGFDTQTGTRFGEPALTAPEASVSTERAWAVQVASFASQSNARKLRERLRDAKYEAFISSHKTAQGEVMHRVASGPYLSRAQAEEVRSMIGEQFSMQPTLVNFGR